MSYPLLLDEMFSGSVAEKLRAAGHDVLAVVTDPALVALSDDQILGHAAAITKALTAPLDQPTAMQPGQVVFLARRKTADGRRLRPSRAIRWPTRR